MLRNWLAHPLTHGLDLNDPCTTHRRRQIICEKIFLHRIYEEWYQAIAAALPAGEGRVLELGSGAGFLNEIIPGLITSEIFACPGVTLVLDGLSLPCADGSLRAIVMTDVLHHLPRAGDFFSEAARCVRRGGRIVMIEPWVTTWSRVIYTHFHHEPFRPDAADWNFPSSGPLSGANQALPWILFERDRARFEREFPEWGIESIRPMMPLRYLVSGGVSLRSLMPGGTFAFWRGLEKVLEPFSDRLGMFALIVLRRN